jgi:nitroreductase
MMLAAKSLGIDSCPVGLAIGIEQTPVYKELPLSAEDRIYLAITLGYGNESPQRHNLKENDIIYLK